jgi:hypothetical protein
MRKSGDSFRLEHAGEWWVGRRDGDPFTDADYVLTTEGD